MLSYILLGIGTGYILCVIWILYEVYRAPEFPNEWDDYVAEAIVRETKADLQLRKFRVIGAQSAWVDYGAHDNGDGTTSWYAQDGRSTRYLRSTDQ